MKRRGEALNRKKKEPPGGKKKKRFLLKKKKGFGQKDKVRQQIMKSSCFVLKEKKPRKKRLFGRSKKVLF